MLRDSLRLTIFSHTHSLSERTSQTNFNEKRKKKETQPLDRRNIFGGHVNIYKCIRIDFIRINNIENDLSQRRDRTEATASTLDNYRANRLWVGSLFSFVSCKGWRGADVAVVSITFLTEFIYIGQFLYQFYCHRHIIAPVCLANRAGTKKNECVRRDENIMRFRFYCTRATVVRCEKEFNEASMASSRATRKRERETESMCSR